MTTSKTLARRVLQSTESPNRLIFWQKQEYAARVTRVRKVSAAAARRADRGLTRRQVVESIVIVDLDEQNRIVRLVDQCEGRELPTRWGADALRRLNAMLVPWVPWLGHIPRNH